MSIKSIKQSFANSLAWNYVSTVTLNALYTIRVSNFNETILQKQKDNQMHLSQLKIKKWKNVPNSVRENYNFEKEISELKSIYRDKKYWNLTELGKETHTCVST